jgi:hypothetical protein
VAILTRSGELNEQAEDRLLPKYLNSRLPFPQVLGMTLAISLSESTQTGLTVLGGRDKMRLDKHKEKR